MLQRIRQVFGGDRRAQESLDQAASTGAEEAARELAAALRWYAERDRDFAAELERWAASPQPHVTQTVHAGRDAYVAGGDQTVTHHHKRADD
ncbi:MAG TPA: hypothetical protein VFU43_11720 [Streptosporangiaceae bacterium]|nr:hypothetical protein [Streptosporangiaceae bacterium]